MLVDQAAGSRATAWLPKRTCCIVMCSSLITLCAFRQVQLLLFLLVTIATVPHFEAVCRFLYPPTNAVFGVTSRVLHTELYKNPPEVNVFIIRAKLPLHSQRELPAPLALAPRVWCVPLTGDDLCATDVLPTLPRTLITHTHTILETGVCHTSPDILWATPMPASLQAVVAQALTRPLRPQHPPGDSTAPRRAPPAPSQPQRHM